MAGNATTPKPYTIRFTKDFRGKEHVHFRMPTTRGGAWVELYDLPADAQFRRMIFDEEYLPEWKLEYLGEQYAVFRERENARKHATVAANMTWMTRRHLDQVRGAGLPSSSTRRTTHHPRLS